MAATYLQLHPNVTVYLDLPAAGALTRIATPWLLGPVEWTPEATERAVVWLAQTVKQAILKLSAPDYADHHLSSLLARYGTPGPLNGEIFNRLREKIRGRARLMKGKRVLVFSPHPDDDVISMGGILRKLRENQNDIVVAYMTSGNIAVMFGGTWISWSGAPACSRRNRRRSSGPAARSKISSRANVPVTPTASWCRS